MFARDGDRVQCHICGKLCKSVGNHAFLAHGVTADDYRTIFGLKSSTGLVTSEISERRSQVPEGLRAQQGVNTQYLAAGRRSRPLALEARLDPTLQDMRRAAGKKGGARNRERWADPEEHQRRGEQLSAARGGRVDVTCASCGAQLQVPPSAAKAYRHHLCSDPCIAAFRAWWAKQLLQIPRHRQHYPLSCTCCGTAFQGQRGQRFCSRRCRNRVGHAQRRTPTICPTCGQTFAAAKNQHFCSQRCAQRQISAETAARLSALRRQHGRPHAEVLRSLPDSAFAVLSPLEQQVVRLYYGLDDGHPWSQREIGHHCRVAVVRVRPIVHAAVARLVATDQTHTGQ